MNMDLSLSYGPKHNVPEQGSIFYGIITRNDHNYLTIYRHGGWNVDSKFSPESK